jgi:hypothetical protein
MKRIIITIVWSVLFITGIAFAAADDGAGTASATFLKLGQGARPSAMGEAFTAVASDADASYWNPAGLSKVEGFELAALYNTWIADINYGYASVAYPVAGIGTFAGSMIYLDCGKIPVTDNNGILTPYTVTPTSIAGSLSFGRDFSGPVPFIPDLSLGISAKYIHEVLGDGQTDYPGTAFACDLGILTGGYFKTGQSWLDSIKAGFSVQNLGTKMKFDAAEESLPVVLRFGIASDIYSQAENHKVTMSVDGVMPSDNTAQANAGIEYWYHEMFAVRAGYRGLGAPNNSAIGGLAGLTIGAGLKIRGIGIDFAWVPMGDLTANTFRGGIVFDLAEFSKGANGRSHREDIPW